MILTQQCYNWNFFATQLLYFCCEVLKDFQAIKNVKILKFKGDWANYNLEFASKNNPLQNIFGKVKKSNKVRQYQKALISVFAHFLSTSAKNLFLLGKLDMGLCPHEVFRFH